MTTTIQIENPTKELLNELKKSFQSKTYDDVIQKLVRKKTKSMYGALAKGKKISAAQMMKGLRDKSDRY
jgi:predicted CopG family antitoxin